MSLFTERTLRRLYSPLGFTKFLLSAHENLFGLSAEELVEQYLLSMGIERVEFYEQRKIEVWAGVQNAEIRYPDWLHFFDESLSFRYGFENVGQIANLIDQIVWHYSYDHSEDE